MTLDEWAKDLPRTAVIEALLVYIRVAELAEGKWEETAQVFIAGWESAFIYFYDEGQLSIKKGGG